MVSKAAENAADGRSTNNNNNGSRLIGRAVENELDSTLWRLIVGEIGLHEVTPALAAFWHLGYDAGRASLLPELHQARADRDRYFRAAFDTPDQMRQRLVDGARDFWSEFVAGGDGRG